ncbi:DNA (cytosine-5)-methyltransferase 1 [Camellia lanceoleosa]|uniref:DNA (Cytosine-5)-methyltransferase 1 n=1 Tax=Camellia lanceoleosa TaxID=1840588 RepID=A0ACC0INE0_9ERIC|nr:DNA (cytosine-5)-methyltransferase 1 [Camellia lanceoleosa]
MKQKRSLGKPKSNISDAIMEVTAKPLKTQMSESTENVSGSRKMPKQAAACRDFKHKSVRICEPKLEMERVREVEDESEAISLTTGENHPRPNRRLTDFVFHDEDGKPRPVEMLEVIDIFITGLILPLEETNEKDKVQGVRCERFGPLESWAISGYDDGSPVIWVSTEIADYDCVKPANSYKNLYCLFYEKAHACIDIYQKLSRSCGGDPNQSLEELLAKVVRSMSGRNNFPRGMSVRDFIVSQGEFIFYQLIGLDETSNKNEQMFSELPVLAALRDESKKNKGCVVGELIPSDRVLDTNMEIRDKA